MYTLLSPQRDLSLKFVNDFRDEVVLIKCLVLSWQQLLVLQPRKEGVTKFHKKSSYGLNTITHLNQSFSIPSEKIFLDQNSIMTLLCY